MGDDAAKSPVANTCARSWREQFLDWCTKPAGWLIIVGLGAVALFVGHVIKFNAANVDLAGLVLVVGIAVLSFQSGRMDKLEAKIDQLSAEVRDGLARVDTLCMRVDLLREGLQPYAALMQPCQEESVLEPAENASEEVQSRDERK